MVVKRQCSFCADEIEPGTGMMFVKRDGTIFHFCSSSCRKQQLHLGRVGHRRKWTRAHAMKKAQSQAHSRDKAAASKPSTAPAPPAEPALPMPIEPALPAPEAGSKGDAKAPATSSAETPPPPKAPRKRPAKAKAADAPPTPPP